MVVADRVGLQHNGAEKPQLSLPGKHLSAADGQMPV
jgi:hypothetical protein